MPFFDARKKTEGAPNAHRTACGRRSGCRPMRSANAGTDLKDGAETVACGDAAGEARGGCRMRETGNGPPDPRGASLSRTVPATVVAGSPANVPIFGRIANFRVGFFDRTALRPALRPAAKTSAGRLSSRGGRRAAGSQRRFADRRRCRADARKPDARGAAGNASAARMYEKSARSIGRSFFLRKPFCGRAVSASRMIGRRQRACGPLFRTAARLFFGRQTAATPR